ncbi:unnamed protein product [Phaedon cochleariae]|uniref:NADH dehydrogenase [ubiquinone] iron-sulfur protein 4, mitochondrial n=1 Tax=Phaedon cochleariae TaxID=80249 RepID=A0A9P0DJZ4_PHACE|nr:unnamed protein product [Phaedon cochleariae]
MSSNKIIILLQPFLSHNLRKRLCSKNCSDKNETAKIDKQVKKESVPKAIDEAPEIPKSITIPISGDTDMSLLKEIPKDILRDRTAKISKPSRNVMQSGTNNLHHWQLTFDTKERWENPNIGWCSSGDPMSNVKLQFTSKQEAIAYCEKNKFRWILSEGITDKRPRRRSYRDNFVNKRCRVSTK